MVILIRLFYLVRGGAPGATRTHTGRILSPLPLPIGLRGRDEADVNDGGITSCQEPSPVILVAEPRPGTRENPRD